MNEKTIQSEIQLDAGSRSDVRLFRNNVGTGYNGELLSSRDEMVVLKGYRLIRFGLHVGSGDLIGWKTVTITPNMVGKKVAVFLSVETKTHKGVHREEQTNWVRQVQCAGGRAGFAKTVEESRAIING